MARRSLATHGAFVRPILKPDWVILDLGCGPGAMTLDLARHVPQGRVVGIDRAESQIAIARAAAADAGVANAEFQVAEANCLGQPENRFDLIFSHALFEHLPDPVGVLRHLKPLLRPGGQIAMRSPDWGGWVLHPEWPEVDQAIAAYGALQRSNGGDTHAGRKFSAWLSQTGFTNIRISATYEFYPSAALIADYIANQLAAAGSPAHADAFRRWARTDGAFFAHSWFEAIAQKP